MGIEELPSAVGPTPPDFKRAAGILKIDEEQQRKIFKNIGDLMNFYLISQMEIFLSYKLRKN